jgi:hypothetical protein
MLGRGAILALALAVIAQYTLIVAETSRLPMVAGWAGVLPEWFTRLDPRFGTPVRSIVVIVILAIIACSLATFGADAHEALQLINVTDAFLHDIYFGMMFLIPLVAGSRFGRRPSLLPQGGFAERISGHRSRRRYEHLSHHQRAESPSVRYQDHSGRGIDQPGRGADLLAVTPAQFRRRSQYD